MPKATNRLSSSVPGVSRTSLWNAWKQIRQELRHSRVRDVVDHFEFDLDPEVWIRRLIGQLASGSYEPKMPRRFTLAKGNGFSRRMTLPSIPDLVLYRAIAHHVYQRALRRERRHVYFERAKIAKVQDEVQEQARQVASSPYTGFRRRRFLAWLRYDQYRKHLILEETYPFIVLSDVTNFFDSTQYQRIADALAGIASARMLGLLFFLLERLSIREPYSGSPLVGLPVDEFDCSRALAHMVLFPHDERMVARVGEAAYVRWMDDQNIGVRSRAEGLAALAALGASLASLHLTANSGKSKILTLAEARRHFHLDLNATLDDLENAKTESESQRRSLRKGLAKFWKRAKAAEGIGEWDKILKRTYRLASVAQGRMLRYRCISDVLRRPEMVDRIADYMRTTGGAEEFLQFAEALWAHTEQIFPDVNLALFERLLLLDAVEPVRKRLRTIAIGVLRGDAAWPGAPMCQSVAPLLLLKFGDRRNRKTLLVCLRGGLDNLGEGTLKACALTLASFGRDELAQVRELAGKLLRGELSESVRMLERLSEMEDVPKRFHSRLEPIWDATSRSHYIDVRRLLMTRLILLNENESVRAWVGAKVGSLLAKAKLGNADRRLLGEMLSSVATGGRPADVTTEPKKARAHTGSAKRAR